MHYILQSFATFAAMQKNEHDTLSSHSNPTFVWREFFQLEKKALQRFANHEKSEMHRETIMKLAAKPVRIDISGQLSTSHATETRNNRAMFL